MHSIFVFDDVEAAGGIFPDGWVVPADVVGWDADGVGDGFEGVVGAAVIGVENTPGLEVRNDTFNKGAVDDVLAVRVEVPHAGHPALEEFGDQRGVDRDHS